MDTPKLKTRAKDVPQETKADEDREPTKEEIMEDIRQGLRQVLAGERGRPARESIKAIRQRIYGDAKDC